MRNDLTAKQRDSALQHWCSQIARESRDLPALDRIGARALNDRDVRADGLLQSMIRAEIERHRADLEQAAQEERGRAGSTAHPSRGLPPARHTAPSASTFRRDDSEEEFVTLPPLTVDPPPDPDGVALEQQRGEVTQAADLKEHERRVIELNSDQEDLKARIAALGQRAQDAARRGDVQGTVNLLYRLTAMHAAHPRLLDQAGLTKMRDDVARAQEGGEDALTARRVLNRQREVAAEVSRLASAVSCYRKVVINHPQNSTESRAAAQVYEGALSQTHLHENDWLAEFVLEMADLLANWNVPPPGAAEQIDRFLERLSAALQRVRSHMDQVRSPNND